MARLGLIALLCSCSFALAAADTAIVGQAGGGTWVPKVEPLLGAAPDSPDRLTASSVVQDITVGWNLGNALDCSGSNVREEALKHTDAEPLAYETWWGSAAATPALFVKLKAKGFNAVRIPVTWVHHLQDDGKGNISISPRWMARVKEVVDSATKAGLYCIINTHHDASGFNEANAAALGLTWKMTYPLQWIHADSLGEDSNEAVCKRLKTVWTLIAKEFASYDNRLIFEGFNEVLDAKRQWRAPTPEQTQNLNRLNQAFVDAVRATGGNNARRVLSIQTFGAYAGPNIEGFAIPTDCIRDAIIVQVHIYTNLIGKPVDDLLAYIAGAKGEVPMVLGEFGFESNMPDEFAVACAKSVVAIAKKHGIKVFWWDNGLFGTNPNCAGLINRKTLSWEREVVADALLAGLKADPNKSLFKSRIELNAIADYEFAGICCDLASKEFKTDAALEVGKIFPTTKGSLTPVTFVSVSPGDRIGAYAKTSEGFRFCAYAFYDADFKPIPGQCQQLADSVVFHVVVPEKAKYLKFSLHNPWGWLSLDNCATALASGALMVIVESSGTVRTVSSSP